MEWSRCLGEAVGEDAALEITAPELTQLYTYYYNLIRMWATPESPRYGDTARASRVARTAELSSLRTRAKRSSCCAF
jgi:hypothetical protein